MPRDYARIEASAVFGLVAGRNVSFLSAGGREGRLVAVSVCERVLVWDLITKDIVHKLYGDKQEVTSLARSPTNCHLAVGYRDGYVRIFDITSQDTECSVVFHGHRRAITALAYEHNGMRLASGSQDTDVTVWDVVSESGLYRLKGHTNEVTKVQFVKHHNVLVTSCERCDWTGNPVVSVMFSSKDRLVKFWDLAVQHCFRTLVHKSEVYSFVLVKDDHRLISSCCDNQLRVWDVKYSDDGDDKETNIDQPLHPLKQLKLDNDVDEAIIEEDENSQILRCITRGSVTSEFRTRVIGLMADDGDRYLLCQSVGRKVEIFILPSEDELQKKLKKRRKKARLRGSVDVETDIGLSSDVTLNISDEIRRVGFFTAPSKLRALDFIVSKEGHLQAALLFSNNSVAAVDVVMDGSNNVKLENSVSIHHAGHRSEVRTLSFSFDGKLILSASAEQAKLWNSFTVDCVGTVACDYALCSTFVPGNDYFILGTKSGKLQIFDVRSIVMISSIDAHDGSLWSLNLAPKDQGGIISGGKDCIVKFWRFELFMSTESGNARNQLRLAPFQNLKMDEEITCVMYSPDQRLVVVALNDNTVKVFFADSLKLFHNLYGSSAPIVAMDICTDSTLLVTGSIDREVKIWALDFGDIRKKIHAHEDSVSCIKFIPKTHMFFSGSKDKMIKHWDADSHQHIVTLKGHHGDVRSLAVSPCGHYLASSSSDFSLRLWERTDGIVIPDDEREQEQEEVDNLEIVAQSNEPAVAGEEMTNVLATRRTLSSAAATERLMESIQIYEQESARQTQCADNCVSLGNKIPQTEVDVRLRETNAISPAHYFLLQLQKIRLRIHHGQLTSNQMLQSTMELLQHHMQARSSIFKHMIGFNLHGLGLLRLIVEEKAEQKLFSDATAHFKDRKRRGKLGAPVAS